MNARVAILIDGGFIRKALSVHSKKFPSAAEIEAECNRIMALAPLNGHDLLRGPGLADRPEGF